MFGYPNGLYFVGRVLGQPTLGHQEFAVSSDCRQPLLNSSRSIFLDVNAIGLVLPNIKHSDSSQIGFIVPFFQPFQKVPYQCRLELYGGGFALPVELFFKLLYDV